MDANELFMGMKVIFNCISGSQIIVSVTGFDGVFVSGQSEQGSHWCRINEVEPIPLIKEILERNGFYYGYTSNEEDLASNTIAQLSEEDKGWVWDEGAGSVKVIFPNESDGGEIQLCDQSFDRDITFTFVENIMLHELQNLLNVCHIKKEIEL